MPSSVLRNTTNPATTCFLTLVSLRSGFISSLYCTDFSSKGNIYFNIPRIFWSGCAFMMSFFSAQPRRAWEIPYSRNA